jgi:hypothetical protein
MENEKINKKVQQLSILLVFAALILWEFFRATGTLR